MKIIIILIIIIIIIILIIMIMIMIMIIILIIIRLYFQYFHKGGLSPGNDENKRKVTTKTKTLNIS